MATITFKMALALAAFVAAAFFFGCATFGVDLGDVPLVEAGLFSFAIGTVIEHLPWP